MNNIKKFKSQEDYVINITDDNVTNIIGTKGSGKTTNTKKYIEDDDYIVINCDRLFDLPSFEIEDKELSNIKEMLKEKYGSISEDNFKELYNSIIEYILKKKKNAIIEGNVIQDLPIESLKGKVIVKRTAIFKSYMRAVKRDFKNPYFLKLEKENHKYLYKFTRLKKIAKRRTSIFKQGKEINEKIEELNNISAMKK